MGRRSNDGNGDSSNPKLLHVTKGKMHCSDVGSLIERNPNRIERELRKQKRRDVRNYLHSIAIDASWLDEVVDLYASAGCASWPECPSLDLK